jgi:hypothetical protein
LNSTRNDAEGLAAPLRAEAEQDHAAVAVLHVDARRPCLAGISRRADSPIAAATFRSDTTPARRRRIHAVSNAGLPNTKMSASFGMPAITGCVGSVVTRITDPPRRTAGE